jgi:hypothetical protein
MPAQVREECCQEAQVVGAQLMHAEPEVQLMLGILGTYTLSADTKRRKAAYVTQG